MSNKSNRFNKLSCQNGSVIKRPAESTTSTTSGQRDTTRGQTSTTSRQTNGQTSITSGQTSPTSG